MRAAAAVVVVVLAAMGLTAWERVGAISPPPMAAAAAHIDRVVVDKSERRLWLMKDGVAVREYAVSLGNAPTGHKQREGDERTPTGDYTLDWRNPRSVAHLSLHVSYPDANDHATAADRGDDPGGMIMIHGVQNGLGWLGPLHRLWDWTDGCIAVTNAEVREIWALTPTGTPITIRE